MWCGGRIVFTDTCRRVRRVHHLTGLRSLLFVGPTTAFRLPIKIGFICGLCCRIPKTFMNLSRALTHSRAPTHVRTVAENSVIGLGSWVVTRGGKA